MYMRQISKETSAFFDRKKLERVTKKETAVAISFCTRGRGRTGTPVKELVFETSASTDSATRAFGMPFGIAKVLHFFEIKAFFLI